MTDTHADPRANTKPHFTRPDRQLAAFAVLATVIGGLASAMWGPAILLGLGAVTIFALTAYRPVTATYIYLATLPFLAGIDRGAALPILRPNEAVLALVIGGATTGGYIRFVRGDPVLIRLRPLDGPLIALALMAVVWPIAWMLVRGISPAGSDLAAVLPVCKLLAILVLVRTTVRTERQVMVCTRLLIWSAAMIAVIAILQTFAFPPLLELLRAFWSDPRSTDLSQRGTTTLASSIATGDYIIIALVLLIISRTRGMLGRREGLVLGFVLVAGILASGQFSTWLAAIGAAIVLLVRFPRCRPGIGRLLPMAVLAGLLGAPAFVLRISAFGGGPSSWAVRWANLNEYYIPRLTGVDLIFGVSPNSVLPAQETWRDLVYLESGYLQLLWIGGLPLLVAFLWLSVSVLRHARTLAARPGYVGVFASALEVVWLALLVLTLLDPHLFLRGTGDVLFFLIGITTGRLYESASHGDVCRNLTQWGRDLPPLPTQKNWTLAAQPRRRTAQFSGSVGMRAFDVVCAGTALIMLGIPMLIVGVLICIESHGPALFCQQRLGLGREPFTLYKFRTMYLGLDDSRHREMIARELNGENTSSNGSWKLDGDSRITQFGAWLRRTSFDELPQLINVLRGEMSLVGPRPCLPWEAEIFPPGSDERFTVRPGLTGLWQISGRSTLGTLDMLRLDVTYARSRGFWTDLSILAKTILVLLRKDGAR